MVTHADERRFYRFLIRTIFVVVSAGSLIALFGEQFWVAELFTHFRLYYLLIQALLLLIFLHGGHRTFMVMTLLLAVPNAWVVQYRNDEFARVTDYLRERDPDIIVISEFTPAWRSELKFLHESHSHRLADARSDPWGLAVFSRLPFAEAELIDLAQTNSVHARFVVEVGSRPLEVFAVHFFQPTSSIRARNRNLQIEDLTDRLIESKHRRLVVGDMNLTPFSPYFSRLADRSGLQDARRVDGIHITWPTSALPIWIPIDHALADSAVNVVRVLTGPDIGSDHFPLEILVSEQAYEP